MKEEIISQYNNALHMLANVIELCPESLWNDDVNYENTYWRIVYHTLFYTALYLSKSPEHFTRWEKHETNYNRLGKMNDDGEHIVITVIYTKEELGKYLQTVCAGLDESIDDATLSAPSGFEWLPMNKLELYLYNLRHIQHHTGQLVERLHTNGVTRVAWY